MINFTAKICRNNLTIDKKRDRDRNADIYTIENL